MALAAEGMSWLTSSLEQATAMVPPSERHAIHKLWTKMEDAIDGKELTAAQAATAVRGAFTNLCNLYVEQAQQSAHAKAREEEARTQMLEERDRFRQHNEVYKQKLDSALGVARKSSSVAEDWRAQAQQAKANCATIEDRHRRLVAASAKLLHAREGNGLSPQKGASSRDNTGADDDTLLVVRLSYDGDGAGKTGGAATGDGASMAEPGDTDGAGWDGVELNASRAGLQSRPHSAGSPANFGRPADFDSPIQPSGSKDSLLSHGSSSHDAAASLLAGPGPLRAYRKDKVPIGGVRRGAGEEKRPMLPGNSMFNRPASAEPMARSRRRPPSAARPATESG
eukprot:COSAG06_NODE_1419_length_9522_cov_6.137005_3_plen_339_part_00